MSWIQGLSAQTIAQALRNGDFLPHQVEEAETRLIALTVDRPRTLIMSHTPVTDDRPRDMIALN